MSIETSSYKIMKTQPRQHISNYYNTCTSVYWVQANNQSWNLKFGTEIEIDRETIIKQSIAPDKVFFFHPKTTIFFLFLNKKHQGGASNEYPQHMFILRIKKIIMWILPLIWSYATNN